MFKSFRKQEGFTLIELMIVVAIIGILAAIAIPNFLTYQLKSRQAEAKTNLQAIKTSEVAFQAERGCYVGIAVYGAAAPVAGTKTVPFPWGGGPVALGPGTQWCLAGGVFGGSFTDIGFIATGNVMFIYGVDSTVAPTVGTFTGYTSALSCPLAIAGTAAAALPVQNDFVAMAKSNLDGDAGISTWDSTVDHGATDCTTGVF